MTNFDMMNGRKKHRTNGVAILGSVLASFSDRSYTSISYSPSRRETHLDFTHRVNQHCIEQLWWLSNRWQYWGLGVSMHRTTRNEVLFV